MTHFSPTEVAWRAVFNNQDSLLTFSVYTLKVLLKTSINFYFTY